MPTAITAPPPIATWFERIELRAALGWAEVKDFLGSPDVGAAADPRRRAVHLRPVGAAHLRRESSRGTASSCTRPRLRRQPGPRLHASTPSAARGARRHLGGGRCASTCAISSTPIPITIGVESAELHAAARTSEPLAPQPARDRLAAAQRLRADRPGAHARRQVRRTSTSSSARATRGHELRVRRHASPRAPTGCGIRRSLDAAIRSRRALPRSRPGAAAADRVGARRHADRRERRRLRARRVRGRPRDRQRRASTYSPSYVEGGGASRSALRRTIALGASALTRQTERDDQASAEIIDIPNQPDRASGQRELADGRARLHRDRHDRADVARRAQVLALLEVYGRRTRYALDYCALPTARATAVAARHRRPDTSRIAAAAARTIDAWIGQRLRLFASYDLSSALDFTPKITGYKSLRLMMEGVY